MKKIFFKPLSLLSLVILCALLFSACKKSSDDARQVSTAGFTWNIAGVTYTADADTAYTSFKTIIASKDVTNVANSKIFEIDLSSLAVGAYTLTSSGSNQVNYVTGGASVATSQSGTLNITANASNKLSGNFSTTLTGSVVMTGTFTDVPVQP